MLNKLTSNVFYLSFNHDTDRPNLGCVVGQDAALLIDAGNFAYAWEKFFK